MKDPRSIPVVLDSSDRPPQKDKKPSYTSFKAIQTLSRLPLTLTASIPNISLKALVSTLYNVQPRISAALNCILDQDSPRITQLDLALILT